jgi:hypothetical protein
MDEDSTQMVTVLSRLTVRMFHSARAQEVINNIKASKAGRVAARIRRAFGVLGIGRRFSYGRAKYEAVD